MRIGLSQEPDALAVQGAVAHTAVRKSLIPWTKDRGPLKCTRKLTLAVDLNWGEGQSRLWWPGVRFHVHGWLGQCPQPRVD